MKKNKQIKPKIKKHYFCLVNKHNQIDYRFLFELKKDANLKLQAINRTIAKKEKAKNSNFSRGEVIDLRKKSQRNNFFRIKKFVLVDQINPQKTFQKIIPASSSITKQKKQIRKDKPVFQKTQSQEKKETHKKIVTKIEPSCTKKITKPINLNNNQTPFESNLTNHDFKVGKELVVLAKPNKAIVNNFENELIEKLEILPERTTFARKNNNQDFKPLPRALSFKFSVNYLSPRKFLTFQSLFGFFRKRFFMKNKKVSFKKAYPESVNNEKSFSCNIPNFLTFAGFRWECSFLRTKIFASFVIFLCALTVGIVFFINQKTANTLAENLLKNQTAQTEKIVVAQTKTFQKKEEKEAKQFDKNLNNFVLNTLLKFDNVKSEELENEIREILKGTPMEEMAPMIAKKDRRVAAFMIGIAMQESGFGRHAPVLEGKTCYNNWGYREVREKMGSGGHTCFDSPEDAVDTVADRIERLVKADVSTPREMVLWKCGSACDTHSQESVDRWINNVSIYFNDLTEEEVKKNLKDNKIDENSAGA